MKTNPDTLKVLMALAKNLRASAKNVRKKQALVSIYTHNNSVALSPAYDMSFQAMAMHHALYNAFFIAKKTAGRKI